MSAIGPALQKMGVGLAFIGNGTPAHARDFRESQGLAYPLYVDPARGTYAAFDFKEGVGVTFAPATIMNGMRAVLNGFRQGARAGAPFQQGGVVLALPDGRTPYVYRSAVAGDHPAPEAVLKAVAEALEG